MTYLHYPYQLSLINEMFNMSTLTAIITVARDRDSDSERLLYFGRVIYFFLFFFPSTKFRHPWADFRETLPHDAVCAEIVYLL